MKKRLGCLSPAGIAAALGLLAVLVVVGILGGGRLFSPGPLNAQAGDVAQGGVRAHAETGGECAACHPAPWSGETMADRCLACHTGIAGEMRDAATLHGALLAGEPTVACRPCHTEHQGAEAQLTSLDPDAFPHEATGYSLQGHAELAPDRPFVCADCHGLDLTRFDPAVCADCHRDLDAAYMQAHGAAFGSGCLACHDGLDTYGARFDHDQTAFPLAGRHAPLACAGCHGGARSVADLQAAPRDCYACHEADDAHQGQFGADCAACHTPTDWAEATFDHSLADFPLEGRHQDVACNDCHANAVFAGTPQDCYACHEEPDYHVSLLGTACADCHTADGWTPARFDGAHPFPFDHGESGASPCRTCHPDRLSAYTCYECHEHTPAEIEVEHREEGISDFQNCVECHPTGQKDEAEGDED